MAPPMTLVLFGATGDLARNKLWPALHDLAGSGRLPEKLAVIGVSRSASAEDLRSLAAEHGPKGARLETTERWEELLRAIDVANGAADDPELYAQLERKLEDCEGARLTYLSVHPKLFGEIAGRLAAIGLGREAHGRSHVVVEKPFGEDLASAIELRRTLHDSFEEDQLLRIDHYLGKEAAQNLLVLRFVNGIFEPLWDRRSIESVQITVAESGGVEGRADFYDATGALRDVAQNHMLQLLAMTLMDAPTRAAGDELRAERLKVLRSIKPVHPGEAVLGQYKGYGAEEGIAEHSLTDTYAAMRVEIDNWRWAGVPCYLRTGKRLQRKQAEIAIAFRPSPHIPFEATEGWAGSNRLIIGIQPVEHVSLHVTGKRPGAGLHLARVELDFDPGEQASRESPEAYERLLGDALAGDSTLFTSSAEVEAQWKAIAPLLEQRPQPHVYAPGSAGPEAADDLPGRDGRRWRPLDGG